MTYKNWVKMNVAYENKLLKKIEVDFGKTSEQYKSKLEQIKNLKNGKIKNASRRQ